MARGAQLLGGKPTAPQARQRRGTQAPHATRRTLTGEVLPAHLPATAAALVSGAIGTGQLKAITQTMATLAEHAQNFDPLCSMASPGNRRCDRSRARGRG